MTQQTIRILRLPQVEAMVGLRKSALYTLIRAGDFPAQVQLGRKAVGWRSDELQAWITARTAERDAADGPPPPIAA